MKKTILVVSVLLAMTSAMSQGIGRRADARCKNAQLLEPLLPFSEAVEKAKSGNAQGWYALAIYYAKGEEVDRDYQKTCQFMQKACHMNYSNAVFVAAMMLEADCATPEGGFVMPPIDRYVCEEFSQWVARKQQRRSIQLMKDSLRAAKNMPPAQSMERSLSLTNAADVATIRAGYERAFSLGVTVATNELARFERRISSYQEEVKKKDDEKKRKEENAKLAEGLLIDFAPPKKQ